MSWSGRTKRARTASAARRGALLIGTVRSTTTARATRSAGESGRRSYCCGSSGMRQAGRVARAARARLPSIAALLTQVVGDQALEVGVHRPGRRPDPRPQLDRGEVEVETGRFGRGVTGEEGDVLQGHSCRLERGQPLVAEGVGMELGQAQGDTQHVDYVIE